METWPLPPPNPTRSEAFPEFGRRSGVERRNEAEGGVLRGLERLELGIVVTEPGCEVQKAMFFW